jgi:hypothetical protein
MKQGEEETEEIKMVKGTKKSGSLALAPSKGSLKESSLT